MKYSTLEGAILQSYAEEEKKMAYTDDPVADYEAYDRENQAWLEKHPVCDMCGEHITDEHFFLINGEKVCEECLNDHYRQDTDDYMED